VARETFSARFKGHFDTGPGRFTDQALLTHIVAGGTSNQFFHGNVTIVLFTPVDPSQPVTGQAILFNKTNSSTGTALGMDLTGDRPSDPMQPPTHFTWTVNGSSGGAYTGATGQGTLDIAYSPGGRRAQRAFLSGTAGTVFRGMVNTPGVGNVLQFSG
jgi:hypothetical protein